MDKNESKNRSDQQENRWAYNPELKVKKPWQAWLTGSPVLFVSVLVHLLFLALALFFVVQRIREKRKQTFTEQSINLPTPQPTSHVQITRMNAAQSAPEVTQKIMTNVVSAVNLPAVDLPSDNPGEGTGKMGATNLGGASETGQGMGSGGTQMNIDVATIAASVFGLADGKGLGLQGNFYDLKQTRSREATGVTIHKYAEVITDYINKGWPDDYFKGYFAGPKPLYAPQIFMPYMVASDGPKAFGLQDLVQPRLWLVHYEGKVQVPHTATYRFVGYADDLLEVAIDHKLSLEASYRSGPDPIPNMINQKSTETYKYTFPSTVAGKETVSFAFPCGPWIVLREGQVYDFQILVGEHPGGQCGFWLMVEEKGHTYAMTPQGSPILPLFRVSQAKMPPTNIGCPPFSQEDLGWRLAGDDASGLDSNQ